MWSIGAGLATRCFMQAIFVAAYLAAPLLPRTQCCSCARSASFSARRAAIWDRTTSMPFSSARSTSRPEKSSASVGTGTSAGAVL